MKQLKKGPVGRELRLVLAITRRILLFTFAVFLVTWPTHLTSESIVLSTTYPSPVGVYNRIITTGTGGNNTILARDTGSVGIGTSFPAAKLDVNGSISSAGTVQVGQFKTNPPGQCQNGAIYYNTTINAFRGCINSAWTNFGSTGCTATTCTASACGQAGTDNCGNPCTKQCSTIVGACTISDGGGWSSCGGGGNGYLNCSAWGSASCLSVNFITSPAGDRYDCYVCSCTGGSTLQGNSTCVK